MTPTKTTPGNPQTIAGGSVIKNHSRFNNSYPTLGTYRFGEYTPHFYAETVPADKDIMLRSSYALRSYTLKSPLLNNVKLHKDYFNVPLQAIIPYNYEKFKTNPVQGEDCPDDAGTTVPDFLSIVKTLCDRGLAGVVSTNVITLFRYLLLLQWFFSKGSLLSVAEARFGNRMLMSYDDGIIVNTNCDVDVFTDLVFQHLASVMGSGSFSVVFGNQAYVVYASVPADNPNPYNISLREFWMRFMQQPGSNVTISDSNNFIKTCIENLTISHSFDGYTQNMPLDLRRIHAYNLVCSHFYSNDHIDYVYTAQLYRQNQLALYNLYTSLPYFTMNGVRYNYDVLSGRCLQIVLLHSIESDGTVRLSLFDFLANVFNFNRSLRFMDYFTGARSNPLAIGSTTVPVVGSNVSVIDITKGIQRQRFLNAVNRSGSRFESYIKNLFGVRPEYDFHNPFFLGSTVDDIHSVETDNTGNAQFETASGLDFDTQQNSVTSSFKSSSSRFAFNFDSDRDSVLVGITYFDIPRFYPFGVNRVMLHANRFDDFIPQAQFIGDQDIKQVELGGTGTPMNSFAYTGRYQEYKLRVPYCFGGVFHYLRSWSFLSLSGDINKAISPDFIRSMQTELDKFYLSLSSYSLAGYFHFIILTNNECTSSRPMVKHPHIL